MTSGEEPNFRFHKPPPRITTGAAPELIVIGAEVRPRTGFTPSVEKKPAETM